MDLIEGESKTINLTAKANPTAIKWKWNFNGIPLKKGWNVNGMHINDNLMTIKRVNQSHQGHVIVQGTNEIGTNEIAIHFNVNCKCE